MLVKERAGGRSLDKKFIDGTPEEPLQQTPQEPEELTRNSSSDSITSQSQPQTDAPELKKIWL